MSSFISYLISGISLGSVYAIIALGYTMVYGIAKMLNFAHGDVIMVGSYVVYVVVSGMGLNPILAILLSIIICTLMGVVIEGVAYRPLRNAASPLAVLITAIGVSYLLQNVALLIWGAGAELVFLPIYYTEASLILAQADSMGFETKFFGCDGMDGILGVENFDTSLAEGLMLLTPFAADSTDEKTQNFVKAYKDAYKDTPNQFAADAYDAVYAVKAAAEKEDVKADMDVADICAALEKGMTEITLEGVTGDEITWTEDGEPNKAPKAVEIKDGAYAAME